MLDFIRELFPGEEESYRELLTIDMYLRERLKSRPDFASDQSPYRVRLREIQTQVGKQNHVEALLTLEEAPIYLIFDYGKRDPLTNDAQIRWWKDTEEE